MLHSSPCLVQRSHCVVAAPCRYYGRPFEARNKPKGGAFTGEEKDYFRFLLGAGTVIPAFEEAVAGMRVRMEGWDGGRCVADTGGRGPLASLPYFASSSRHKPFAGPASHAS